MLVTTLLVFLVHSVNTNSHVKKATEENSSYQLGLTYDELKVIEAIAKDEFALGSEVEGVTYDEMIAFAEGDDYDPILFAQRAEEDDSVLSEPEFVEGSDYDPVKFAEGNDYDNINDNFNGNVKGNVNGNINDDFNDVSATQNLDFDVAEYNAWLDAMNEHKEPPTLPSNPQLESLKKRIETLENKEVSVIASLKARIDVLENIESRDALVKEITSRFLDCVIIIRLAGFFDIELFRKDKRKVYIFTKSV